MTTLPTVDWCHPSVLAHVVDTNRRLNRLLLSKATILRIVLGDARNALKLRLAELRERRTLLSRLFIAFLGLCVLLLQSLFEHWLAGNLSPRVYR